MERSLDEQTECCGVTVAQCHVLMELDGGACVNLTGLAARLGLDKSTLSRSVDGLVNAELVDRSVDPDNRRQQVICLSAAGRRRVAAIHSRCDAEYQKLFSLIPKTKHDMVCEAVEILAEALGKN
ncbi:MAG TPA: MarR family winged helix-turn-helix transcriptional regulator [Fibrobacteria bacterium]|nr:MarR family winged helix-turn-helix transcriptional regulator [Fibrobacteria bacterium]